MKIKSDFAPLKIDIPFDEAMRRVVRVPPLPAKKKTKAKKAKGAK